MARQWRLRHKLLFGLGLVLAALFALLGGSLKALISYGDTMSAADDKIHELTTAGGLDDAVNRLASAAENRDRAEGINQLPRALAEVRDALAIYQSQLDHTVERGRDPDHGIHLLSLTDAIRTRLQDFDTAAKRASLANVFPGPQPPALVTDAAVADKLRKLRSASEELTRTINESLRDTFREGRGYQRRITLVVAVASGAGVFFTLCLAFFFRRWMFKPIKQIQRGIERVSRGNFDQPIDLRTGDELQQLAVAFNDMVAKLQATYRDMAQQINERSRQLVRSERLVSVGFLAAGVAHEINNPLASIAFCAEALERRIAELLGRPPAEGEVIAKYLKMIQSEAFRCKEITQRLLQFSRGNDRRAPTDLGEVVQSVLEIAQHLEACRGKQIVLQNTGPLTAVVNAQEVTQVVLNLVVNALESMGEGGKLIITLAKRGGSAELRFSDEGCGMTDEVLENIFEPFYTTKSTGRGTGLGLSISHLIITQHGGAIEAASPGPNQGSTFTVRLPLAAAQEMPAPQLRALAA